MDQRLVELLRGINTSLTVFLDSMSEDVSNSYDEEDEALKRKYPGINFKPPKAVVAELKKGLAWNSEGHGGDGLVAATVSWARRMANGSNISPEKAVKMRAWLARHESDKSGKGFKPGEEGFPSPGRVAWALWGGDPAVGWSNKLVTQMEAADKRKKSVEDSGEPVRLVPPSSHPAPEVVATGPTPTPEPTPTFTPEVIAETSAVAVKEFPLTPAQVMKAKRRDLRDLVEQLDIPISGPNGESASELMVGTLREAIIGYIRLSEVSAELSQVEPDVFFSEKTGESGVTPNESVDSSAELVQVEDVQTPVVEPETKAEVTVTEVTPPQPVEPEVDVQATATDPETAMRVDGFLSWVTSQNTGDTKTVMGNELEGFFSANLAQLDEASRKPVETYFAKLGCQHNCGACPNGKLQPVFCYGVFDEEVTEFSLDDAVSGDQYFKCSPSGDLVHRPS